jgi:hypothetical protein
VIAEVEQLAHPPGGFGRGLSGGGPEQGRAHTLRKIADRLRIHDGQAILSRMPSTVFSTRGRPAPAVLRAAALSVAPVLVRGLTSAPAQRGTRALLSMLRGSDPLERLPFLIAASAARHPLSPAAVRVERTRGRDADQTAVTVWFQEGPGLPVWETGGPPSSPGRSALRLGAGLLGVAAVAAAGTAAARLQAAQPRLRLLAGSLATPGKPA